MSAMREAFKAVGFAPAEERLCDIATEVLELYPRDWVSHETASYEPRVDPEYTRLRWCVVQAKAAGGNWQNAKKEFISRVQSDAALLWCLFEPYRDVAVQRLLDQVSREMHEARKADARGDKEHGTSNTVAAMPQSQQKARQHTAASPGGLGQDPNGSQSRTAQPASTPKPMAPPRDIRAGIEAVINVVRLSLLDTFKIELTGANGSISIAIGDCTPSEADAWAGSRERDVRFVRLLTRNLPRDKKIRQLRTADDVDAIYAEAYHIAAEADNAA